MFVSIAFVLNTVIIEHYSIISILIRINEM
jgi:hypothetical protein